jgi:hypothetical protein
MQGCRRYVLRNCDPRIPIQLIYAQYVHPEPFPAYCTIGARFFAMNVAFVQLANLLSPRRERRRDIGSPAGILAVTKVCSLHNRTWLLSIAFRLEEELELQVPSLELRVVRYLSGTTRLN